MKRILPILLIVSSFAHAQTDFRPGFIVNTAGDTLKGKVDFRVDLILKNICRFEDAAGSITEYTPDQLQSYRFESGRYYVSKTVGGRHVFLEFLIDGALDVFYNKDSNGEHYYLEKDDVPLAEIPYTEEVKQVDGRNVKGLRKHVGFLLYFMQDAPHLRPEIQKLKKPQHKQLIELAWHYHYFKCRECRCIVFEERQLNLKANFEFVMGAGKSFGASETLTHVGGGLHVDFLISRISDKFFFRIGLQHFETGRSTQTILRGQIGYIAPKSYRIRPTVSIGALSPTYSAGVMIRVNEKLNLGVQSWLDCYRGKMPWVPTGVSGHTVLGTVYLDLR